MVTAADGAAGVAVGAAQGTVMLVCPLAPLGALATRFKRRGPRVPTRDGGRQPVFQGRDALGMLAGQRPGHEDALAQ